MKPWRIFRSYGIALLCAVSLVASPLGIGAASFAADDNDDSSSKVETPQPPKSSSSTQFYSTTDRSFIHKYLKPGTYMPLSEVKPGMVGYGLTVFHGNTIERFNVQIISVVKKMLNGRDAILARLSGGEMGKNSVIKGMSGSPCYINGKLIGAVSFGFDFEKEPIAGITPICDMLDALADCSGNEIPLAHLAPPSFAIRPEQWGLKTVAGAEAHVIPLVAPITLSGFSPRAEAMLADKFSKIGLSVTSGGGGGMDTTLQTAHERELQPGSSVCVLLATGDFSIAATGTTTARFGNRVLGFGHPFMSAGNIELPMATGFVHQVMPRMDVSFKLASPVAVVGSLTADRPWGIGGKIGQQSHMIPATYTVVDETRHIQQTYHVQVADHPELTPEMLAATATSAIDATHQAAGPYVAKVESEIDADGIEPIKRVDRFSTGMAPKTIMDLFGGGGDPVGRYVSRTADAICNNDFQKAAIKRVTMKITLQDGHKTADIDRVYIDKPYAAPGEDVTVTAILKPFNHEPIEKKLTFTVPRDVPDGNMLIGIAGGQDYELIKNKLGIVDPEPEDLKQIADKIRRTSRGDQMALVAALPEQSLSFNGIKLTNPPAYWSRVFYSNRHTKGPSLVRGEMKKTVDTDWMLDGSHIVALEVRSPDKANARTAPYSISVPSNNNDDLQLTEQARKSLGSAAQHGKPKTESSGSDAISQAIQVVWPNSNNNNNSNNNSTQTSTQTKATAPTIITLGNSNTYPHVRPLQVWRQDDESDFSAGKLDDATVDSWGRLSPGFESTAEKQVSTEDQIWSGVWSAGNFYYGSGAEIWKWKGGNNKPEKVGKVDGMFVPAMTTDTKGRVYASSVPSGHVWIYDPSVPANKPRVLYTAPQQIISSLASDDKDNIYAGTAGDGKVYKIDPITGKASVLFDSQEAHVLSMFYSKPEQTLYVGTGEKGAVYGIDKDGAIHAVYQSSDHFVTGVAKDAKGNLYISTAGPGHLVRIAPNHEAVTLASSEAFYTLHYDAATDSVFAGDAEGDITMAMIDPMTNQSYFMPVSHTEQEAILALASDGKNLFTGTSNLAVLRSYKMQLSGKPLYTSSVRDASRTAAWSRLHAFGPFNEQNNDLDGKVRVESRTGETSKPDETWSIWKQAEFRDGSFLLTSPPGRYFQYRLSWDTSKDKVFTDKVDRLTLGRIDVTYLPTNSTPAISTISLKPGTALAGKHDVNVTATDPDGDNLLLSLELSSDQGKTWKSVKDDIRSKSASKSTSSKKDDDDDDDSSDKDKSKSKDKDSDSKKDTATTDSDKSKDSDKSTDDKSNAQADKASATDGKTSDAANKAGDAGDKSGSSSDKGGNSSDEAKQKTSIGDEQADELMASTAVSSKKKQKKGKTAATKAASSGSTGKTANAADKDKDKDKKKAESKSSTEGSGTSTENFTYNWDTSKVKDGNYLLKLTVDDRLSNPAQSQQVVNLRSVTVDNTPPEIELIDWKRLPDGRLEFKVTAKDKLTPIANATYKIDDGEPFALGFTPESIDSAKATLIASGVKVNSGSHKVEVKVSDRAGNTATKSITIK